MIYLYRCKKLNSKKYRNLYHHLAYRLLEFGLKYEYNLNLKDLYCLKTEYGKPYLKDFQDIYFNISHCDGMVVCAINNKNIGVDIENIRQFNIFALKKILSDSEFLQFNQSNNKNELFFKLWTLKESYFKNLGTGLNSNFKDIVFNLNGNQIISNKNDFYFDQYILCEKFILSICTDKN